MTLLTQSIRLLCIVCSMFIDGWRSKNRMSSILCVNFWLFIRQQQPREKRSKRLNFFECCKQIRCRVHIAALKLWRSVQYMLKRNYSHNSQKFTTFIRYFEIVEFLSNMNWANWLLLSSFFWISSNSNENSWIFFDNEVARKKRIVASVYDIHNC